jgi:hypothetical protein
MPATGPGHGQTGDHYRRFPRQAGRVTKEQIPERDCPSRGHSMAAISDIVQRLSGSDNRRNRDR